MELTAYHAYTADLTRRLEADPRVLGLVALGSMAGAGTLPDEHSDHDFFVVARTGRQEELRGDLSWLPGAGGLVLAHRETAHGLKVLLEDAHLLELAVFDLDELRVARVNRYAVLLDRGGVADRMAEVARASAAGTVPPGDRWLVGQLLGNLLVGAGRAARGELLSARLFVSAHATRSLLLLLARHVGRETQAPLDDLDPFRRFELAYPALGREVGAALERPPLEAAAALLELAARELEERVEAFPSAAFAAVRRRLVRLAERTSDR